MKGCHEAEGGWKENREECGILFVFVASSVEKCKAVCSLDENEIALRTVLMVASLKRLVVVYRPYFFFTSSETSSSVKLLTRTTSI